MILLLFIENLQRNIVPPTFLGHIPVFAGVRSTVARRDVQGCSPTHCGANQVAAATLLCPEQGENGRVTGKMLTDLFPVALKASLKILESAVPARIWKAQ